MAQSAPQARRAAEAQERPAQPPRPPTHRHAHRRPCPSRRQRLRPSAERPFAPARRISLFAAANFTKVLSETSAHSA